MDVTSPDYDALKFWVDVIFKFGTIAGLVWLAVRRHSHLNGVRLDEHEDRLGGHDIEFAVIKQRLESQPTHQDIQRVHDRISVVGTNQAKTREDIAALLEGMKGVRVAVDRLHTDRLNDRNPEGKNR